MWCERPSMISQPRSLKPCSLMLSQPVAQTISYFMLTSWYQVFYATMGSHGLTNWIFCVPQGEEGKPCPSHCASCLLPWPTHSPVLSIPRIRRPFYKSRYCTTSRTVSCNFHLPNMILTSGPSKQRSPSQKGRQLLWESHFMFPLIDRKKLSSVLNKNNQLNNNPPWAHLHMNLCCIKLHYIYAALN